ncbi:imidazoleglycerol-phosphate dehydratase HisB [Methanothermobacter tenebrarum]|uniref:Imidazoleglycerol-phosphate dehydratase n=1 Tax=Methanothermobacter tenebrarum TaxID=680118 RepID=A0A328PCL7_9EURY|nr:imidazoleglycerol-phosphate dehydratase HisB [Methanothermobacter tenebrarum]MBC7100692.1 imidazoleglycerol-phosphate dehydratase HisB [Methanobacteriales archaeon]MBC7118437.1 imidazoleglycerol-phosphate dehydratase HisB [Methanobacteriaceae archaeon]NPV65375.1 imidazoleglycerol-phosphate dehydratase HisB [Methanobacteriaceae archaeon]RAO78963.1 imidazoleglycerol-phosphate dehydratase HisB [Methanothermobacter tenebrarum]
MMRKAQKSRKTHETEVKVDINLDGEGNYIIDTGLKFLDHMLESFTMHGLFDLEIKVKGDLEVDDHHTIEDVSITLGKAFKKALSDKKGIKRMAHAIVPMDESLAMVAVDLGGRAYSVLDMEFKRDKVGDISTENIPHFMESFAKNAEINIHAKVNGKNDHHKIEALFKALAIALRSAVKIEHQKIPSTKGDL